MPDPLDASTPLARAASGLDACVHCGFCLPACPTYLALEDENASPRGRLVLMRAALDGVVTLDDRDVRTALDTCLGCRACETACPSGVPYGHLLEATRSTQRRTTPLPWVARLILRLFADPTVLRLALAAARVVRATGLAHLGAHLSGRLGAACAMLASTARPASTAGRDVAETASPRGTVACLSGCVMEGLFAETNRATERVLRANGYAVIAAPGQRCCGALHVHAGDDHTARRLAQANILAFESAGADQIAVNSAGCGAMLKEYGQLLRDDPVWAARATRIAACVRDVSELLAAAGPRPAPNARGRVTADVACHLQHAQRITAAPAAVLAALSNVDLVPLAGNDQCCGSAGIYNLVEPEVADAVLAPKLAAIAATGAEVVVTGNPGCLMQIGGGLLRSGASTVARHPVELLDAAYQRPH